MIIDYRFVKINSQTDTERSYFMIEWLTYRVGQIQSDECNHSKYNTNQTFIPELNNHIERVATYNESIRVAGPTESL